jgi:hypothetical protein
MEARVDRGKLTGKKIPVTDGNVAGLAVVAARENGVQGAAGGEVVLSCHQHPPYALLPVIDRAMIVSTSSCRACARS